MTWKSKDFYQQYDFGERKMKEYKYQRRITSYEKGSVKTTEWQDEDPARPFYSYSVGALDHGATSVIITYEHGEVEKEYEYRKVEAATEEDMIRELVDILSAQDVDRIEDAVQLAKNLKARRPSEAEVVSTKDAWAWDDHQVW